MPVLLNVIWAYLAASKKSALFNSSSRWSNSELIELTSAVNCTLASEKSGLVDATVISTVRNDPYTSDTVRKLMAKPMRECTLSYDQFCANAEPMVNRSPQVIMIFFMIFNLFEMIFYLFCY